MSDWKSDNLGRYCYIKARIGWRGLASSEYTENGPYLIAGKHVTGGRVIWGSCDHITHQRYEESLEIALSTGDVILTKDGTIGRVARIDDLPGLATINGTMMLLRPNSEIDYKFLYHTLNGTGFKKHVDDKVSGSSIPHIFQRDMINLPVRFPDRNHQRKIAEVLDTLDTAIQQTEAILEKLKAIKQGLLHDLLIRGIDANGQLRPPQAEAPHLYKESPLGWIPKEWEPTILNEFVSPKRPIVYGILMPGYGFPGGVPVVKVKDIVGGRIRSEDLLLTSPVIDREYSRSRLQSGDLLFTIRGSVGRTAFVPSHLNEANITQDTARISVVDYDARFVREFLAMPIASTFISIHTLGVAVQGINLRDVRKIPILKPSKDEATEIANRLETFDLRIEREAFMVKKMMDQKKALMDDLLTGRVRVTPLLENVA